MSRVAALVLAMLVLALCVVSFLAGQRVGPSLRTYIASITTPNTRPAAASGAVLATPEYGLLLSENCLFVPVDDTGVYFDPKNRQRLCAVLPDSPMDPGTEPDPGSGAALPYNCGVVPDQTVYCSPGWTMDASFLQRLYQRGELPES